MNLNNFTIKAQEMVQHAQQIAFNNQNPNIDTVHLLQALIDESGALQGSFGTAQGLVYIGRTEPFQ